MRQAARSRAQMRVAKTVAVSNAKYKRAMKEHISHHRRLHAEEVHQVQGKDK